METNLSKGKHETIGDEYLFPVQWREQGRIQESFGGLTKKEFFTAVALNGLLSNPQLLGSRVSVASRAVQIADCLIEELNGHGATTEGDQDEN